MLLLSTLHGSRLYGTNRNDSDYDLYRVSDELKSSQSFVGPYDIRTVNIHDFISQVNKGVPGALDALWSPRKTVAKFWTTFFDSMHPNHAQTIESYTKTIKAHLDKDSEKKRRHAIRLTYNLQDFYLYGKFSPVLNDIQKEAIVVHGRHIETTERFIKSLSPIQILEEA